MRSLPSLRFLDYINASSDVCAGWVDNRTSAFDLDTWLEFLKKKAATRDAFLVDEIMDDVVVDSVVVSLQKHVDMFEMTMACPAAGMLMEKMGALLRSMMKHAKTNSAHVAINTLEDLRNLYDDVNTYNPFKTLQVHNLLLKRISSKSKDVLLKLPSHILVDMIMADVPSC